MRLKKLTLAAAATALVAAPIAAQSTLARSSAPISEESELGGGEITPGLIIIALAAVGAGILLITDDDEPASM